MLLSSWLSTNRHSLSWRGSCTPCVRLGCCLFIATQRGTGGGALRCKHVHLTFLTNDFYLTARTAKTVAADVRSIEVVIYISGLFVFIM